MKTKIIVLALIIVVLAGAGYYYNNYSGIIGERYINKEYGFELTLLGLQKDVKISQVDGAEPITHAVHFAFTDIPPLSIFIYPKDKWYQNEVLIGESSVNKLGEDDKYVFGSYIGYTNVSDDMLSRTKETRAIERTFKLQ